MKNTNALRFLMPESELPAEGAELVLPSAENASGSSNVLAAYGHLMQSSALVFQISPEGSVTFDGSVAAGGFRACAISDTPEIRFDVESVSDVRADYSAVGRRVTDAFDATDGLRQLVVELAREARPVGGVEGTPVPLVRWSEDAEQGGGTAQFLGVWLAGDADLETLRASGNDGIILEEAEVEGRGLRETATALAVLGLMMGSTLTAEAGLFQRIGKKKSADKEQASASRQQPARIDRGALSETRAEDTMIIVDVSRQRAFLLSKGEVVLDTPVSTARADKYTPRGEFRITQRVRSGKTSTIYGCELPYWMRLDESAIGLHVGDLPGYPASAGCVRLPSNIAPVLFDFTKSGTTVRIVDSWNPETMVASN